MFTTEERQEIVDNAKKKAIDSIPCIAINEAYKHINHREIVVNGIWKSVNQIKKANELQSLDGR